MDFTNNQDPGSIYQIRIKGALPTSLTDWFGEMKILPQENSELLLVGKFIDQSALRGFLENLWNLNITIVSVERS